MAKGASTAAAANLPRKSGLSARWLGVAIIFVAAALRFAGLDLIEFKGDQAIFLGAAEAALNAGQLPLVGPLDSLGMQAPPFIVYFYQATLYLWNATTLAAWAIGAANVVAVAVGYRVATRYFGLRVGVVAGVLYATGFWAVFYGHKLWNICLHPPFVALLLWAILDLVVGRRP